MSENEIRNILNEYQGKPFTELDPEILFNTVVFLGKEDNVDILPLEIYDDDDRWASPVLVLDFMKDDDMYLTFTFGGITREILIDGRKNNENLIRKFSNQITPILKNNADKHMYINTDF